MKTLAANAAACLVFGILIGWNSIGLGQSGLEDRDSNQEKKTEDNKPKTSVPKGLDTYKGRRIARTMHYSGAEWLIRDEREREERCSLLLTNLGLKKGMTVCDMGCGNGFHSLQIAQLIGEKGQVFGVDIQTQMLKYLRERCEKTGHRKCRARVGFCSQPATAGQYF